jgi:hypothetical protein
MMATILEPMGVYRRFVHNVMGWHAPSEISGFDGCSMTSSCKYCGRQILQDSQGNWFEATVRTPEPGRTGR